MRDGDGREGEGHGVEVAEGSGSAARREDGRVHPGRKEGVKEEKAATVRTRLRGGSTALEQGKGCRRTLGEGRSAVDPSFAEGSEARRARERRRKRWERVQCREPKSASSLATTSSAPGRPSSCFGA